MERKTGARGLRSILEGVLLDVMYDIPSEDSVAKVVVDENVITGKSEPMLIYETLRRKNPKSLRRRRVLGAILLSALDTLVSANEWGVAPSLASELAPEHSRGLSPEPGEAC